jgi:hypothetical protein
MDFKLVSKNNMGIAVTLILVILLSQSRFFDLLTETALGRMFILVLIIFISYTNKFLGLLAVLAIIIAFNQYNMNEVQSYNYYEGFDVSGNLFDISGNQISSATKIAKETIVSKELKPSNDSNSAQIATTSSSPTSGATSESLGGREGFCMTDRESNIIRGKQSNSIAVLNNIRNQDDNISPTDKSVFSSSYASF